MVSFRPMSRERKEGDSQPFVPAASLPDLYEAALVERAIIPRFQANESAWINNVDRGFLQEWLKKIWARTQSQNADWLEDRFRRLRRERGDWSIDGMVVDSEGNIVGASVWSTYYAFRHNAHLQFKMTDLVNTINGSGRLVFPLTPKLDTVLFFQESWAPNIFEAVNKVTQDWEHNQYSLNIKTVRVRRGRFGAAAFSRGGIVLGKLGFWENRRLGLGHFGSGAFVERVSFPQSSLMLNETYISPLSPEEVKQRGGVPMEEKYPNVKILRIDPDKAEADFIQYALDKASTVFQRRAVVLSYTTPRVWLGEMPKHGPGRTVHEPIINTL